MKVALVYDRVNKWGGAERVLLTLHEMFPEAPLYTSVYNSKTAPWAKVFPKVIPSSLQNFPFAIRHELYAILMPLAFESFNFDDYDLVISVTSEAAKGILIKPKTLHVCYCLTPTRYLWSGYEEYFKNPVFRFLSKPVVSYLRSWDKIAAQRPDVYLAISKEVQGRIKKYYERESTVIYPPVNLLGSSRPPHVANDARRVSDDGQSKFSSSLNERRPPKTDFNSDIEIRSAFSSFTSGQAPITQNKNYFLVVSRLVPYKRIDLAIEAFNELGWPLKIVGVGSEMSRLKQKARKNIEFLGNLTDEELIGYYRNCVALVFPGQEDLGLTVLEAQSNGRPVIAFRGGGALETVIEGRTGEFFYPQKKEALVRVLKDFNDNNYKKEDCIRNAHRFSEKRFAEELNSCIAKIVK